MKVVATHSHLGGLEHLLVHKRRLWAKINRAIERFELCPAGSASAKRRRSALTDAFRRGLGSALSRKRGAKARRSEATESIPTREMIGDRVMVAIGPMAGTPWDLHAAPLAGYASDLIDVGVEILPMKELQAQMSSGVAYYEGELYNLIREGRGVPAVPLVLVGVAP